MWNKISYFSRLLIPIIIGYDPKDKWEGQIEYDNILGNKNMERNLKINRGSCFETKNTYCLCFTNHLSQKEKPARFDLNFCCLLSLILIFLKFQNQILVGYELCVSNAQTVPVYLLNLTWTFFKVSKNNYLCIYT